MYMKIIEFENVEFLFKPVHLQQIFVRYSSKIIQQFKKYQNIS